MLHDSNFDSTVSVQALYADDMNSVKALLMSGRRSHIHLDWRELDDMLGDPSLICWGARRPDGKLVACLGMTPGPHGTAWLRLAAVASSIADNVLNTLWNKMQAELRVSPVAVLAFDKWLEEQLEIWGFRLINAVITLQLQQQLPRVHLDTTDIVIRNAQKTDLSAIAQIDAAAFEALWQHDEQELANASEDAAMFTVAEVDSQVVGYLLSTQHGSNGHLARLAVEPGFQRMGVGESLMTDMLSFFEKRGARTVTVNTQQDNHISQKLYRKMGFEQAKLSVPVWFLE